MRLLILTLFGLLAISCSGGNSDVAHSSKGSTMTYSVGTQAELDAANQRINAYRQELLRRVALWTTKLLEKDDQPQLGGGIHASLSDEQADRDFEELYKKVSFVVTGQTQ